MTGAELWRAKLAQLFHDPFVKAFCQGDTAKAIARDLANVQLGTEEAPALLWDAFAQDKVAALLSKRLLGEEIVLPDKVVRWRHGQRLEDELKVGILPARLAPDHAATGADRPNLGTRHQVYVRIWRPDLDHFVITHPLMAAPLKVPTLAGELGVLTSLRSSFGTLDAYRRLLAASSERDEIAWYLMWRRLPEELAANDGVFWSLQPADTRCPDHSIWDHLRVTSALAFIPETQTADEQVRARNPGRRPWLLSLWVGPVRDFVGQSRTGRDLWTGSMLLSELAWALVEPIVKRYGADAVVYPDLRANPRADRWIVENPELSAPVLEGVFRRSYASLIPNRLVALVPEEALDDRLADECLGSARRRWRQMAEAVRKHLSNTATGSGWQTIFDQQIERGPSLRWSAVRWDWDGRCGVKQSDIHLDPAIPFQVGAPGLPQPIREIERSRAERFRGWVPPDIWDHYQAARQTSMMTHAGYLFGQRGFDYALAHHQLLELDAARARLGWEPGRAEPGEKCTLCGSRQALSNRSGGTVAEQRDAAREFWRPLGDEGDGAERLCGPCAVRRYLSNTENSAIEDPIIRNWRGPEGRVSRRGRGRHSEPFPSTGLIAGQCWFEALGKTYAVDPECRTAIRKMVEAFRRSGIRETQFPDSLARPRRLLQNVDETLKAFLRNDVQYLEPDKWDGLARQGIVDQETAGDAKRACDAVRRCVRERPKTRIAVIALDGDRMGRLLLGDPAVVKAPWKDVLHPDAVDQLRSGDQSWKVYWRTTMERPRLMGPSTHAFVTRALREFANRILPWVVEREYGGRLIYAGGDDALILCPADDALDLLLRLHELYTAAWVLDCAPQATAWPDDEPPEPLYTVGSDAARKRFKTLTGDLGNDDDSKRRIVPMLGAHQSFSAGVAFGHYKTSLRLLRAAALDGMTDAKEGGGRRAGLSWFTRNGVKLRWTASLADEPGSVDELRKLAAAFETGLLPSRLPYKLRELLPTARTILGADAIDDDAKQEMLRNLVADALDGAKLHAALIARHWTAGLDERNAPQDADSSLDGLLLARALGGLGDA